MTGEVTEKMKTNDSLLEDWAMTGEVTQEIKTKNSLLEDLAMTGEVKEEIKTKDSLLKDWAMTGEVTEEIKTEERIKKLELLLNKAQTRLARLIAGFKSIQHQLIQRLERLEELTGCHTYTPSKQQTDTTV